MRHSGWVADLSTGVHTHDTLSCGGRRGVSCSDEWRSAGVASVETWHGRKTGIDVWRDWVCRVTLEDEKQKNALFLVSNVYAHVWRRMCWFICWSNMFLWHLRGCSEVKLIGFGGWCVIKRGKASAASLWGLTSWTQTSRKDQIKHKKVSSLHW